MPARKGGKKKKGKKKAVKEQAEPDEFDAMSIAELKAAVSKSTDKLASIRRNRNYYLLERNQFQQFYDIVHSDVTTTQSHIRNIESQMERMQDTHRNDIRMYLQKVIHLEYEHANNVNHEQQEAARERDDEENTFLSKKNDLKQVKLQLKQKMSEDEVKYEEEIRTLKENEKKEMLKLREGFERNHTELQKSYEKRLQTLRNDLELRRKMEIHEIEERKNGHINDLLVNHEKAFTLMRQYYNSITRDNLTLIKSLEDEIELLKVKHEQNEKALEEISRKNTELTRPLKETAAAVADLKENLRNYQKQKSSLRHASARVASLEEQYKTMTVEHRVLQAQYRKLEQERDRLYSAFESTVVSIRDRSEAKNRVLEQVLDEHRDVFETKKAEFTSVLRASNPDPVVLHNVTKQLDDVLTAKNEQIKELKYEVAKITKAHNDLVLVYEDKLRALGIPDTELGMEPLIGLDAAVCGPGNAPADLLVG